MKSYGSKYLDRVKNMNQFKNANGGFRNAGGNQLVNVPGQGGRRAPGWAANGGGNAMSAAPQYILQVSNQSAQNVSGFDVFGASQYLMGNNGGGTWSNNGNFTLNGVTISSLFTTVSYQQILTSSMGNPFGVGGVYLESISGNAAQVTDVYTITSQDAGGKLYSEPIKPFLDPNQFQSGVTYNNAQFNMNALAKITWNTIYASAVFQITLFPAQIIDPSQALNQNQVQSRFGGPKVIGNLK